MKSIWLAQNVNTSSSNVSNSHVSNSHVSNSHVSNSHVSSSNLLSVFNIKNLRSSLVFLGLAVLGSAHALTLEGSSGEGWGKSARLGIFTVLPSGKTALELSSVTLNTATFALELSKVVPNEKSLNTLSPESITWAGVVGVVKLSSAVKVVELKLMVYTDTNTNNKHDEDETLLEPVMQLGRANLILLYADGAVQIEADKGFSIKLNKGYSAITIESGKVVKGSVLEKITTLQLEKP